MYVYTLFAILPGCAFIMGKVEYRALIILSFRISFVKCKTTYMIYVFMLWHCFLGKCKEPVNIYTKKKKTEYDC